MTEPGSRTLDVRVGSSTDALTPVSVAKRSLAARAPQWLGLSVVVVAAVAADQITKLIVSSQLSLDESLRVIGPFAIHHVQNPGIAFGLFGGATSVVTALTALAVGWMLIFFARSGARHPVLPVALGLLIGGSTSNLIDRIRLGHVTDFLDFRYWPAFNLADSFIVVGVGILFVALVLSEAPRREELKAPVPEEAAGERLDRFLASLPEVGSRAAAERLVEEGSVLVDGERRPKSHRLAGGETVELEPPAAPAALEPEEVPLRVACEDEHLLVVDKPAGIVVHPSPGHATGTLVHGLLGRTAGGESPDRPGIVHRLDRDTSGLLVVARSEEAYRGLRNLVRRRGLERRYKALVRGLPRSRTGRIEAPIGRDRHEPTRISLDTDTPRDAVTHFEVERLLDGHALLDVRLETGRTHQIRVHLAAIGLPVVGDSVYGVSDPQLGRQFLHAWRLAFTHPVTGQDVEVESPLPPELQAALERFAS